MATKYSHINIISKDWKKLADFYVNVFGCRFASSETNLIGDWLEQGTGVKNANLRGITLYLPGYDIDGPKLEIFQYIENQDDLKPPAANRIGLRHLAFDVDNIEEIVQKISSSGGKKLGDITQKEFKSGTLTFTYVLDPEDNIIELMNWKSK